MSKQLQKPQRIAEPEPKKDAEPSLKGTFVSVMLLGAFIFDRQLGGRFHLVHITTIKEKDKRCTCVGMFFMSGSMHLVGLLGSPRRTAYTTYQNNPDSVLWMPYHVAMAIGE